MNDLTAAQVRRDAITRLIGLAGDQAYDPDRMRGPSLDILQRRALRRGVEDGDTTVPVQVEILMPVCRGDAGALYDAIQAGGIGALCGDDEPPALTPAQLEDALAGWA